ncbi:hypothetical protein H5410_036751 [Solanum commersonii]|uniref:Uncharacterized protein n=1 Tax=Solanum commersonii TaxID=4109 RepID=A0A9J5Y6J4_SOLCO|nr:hypothetical protein H5410_036751 [Solanum commersonii]
MPIHSLGHQSSGLGFVTSLSRKPKTHRYKKLNLDLSKGRRMEKTHFQLGEDGIHLSSSLPKTLSKLERKISKKYYSILEIKIKTSENSAGGSFDEVTSSHSGKLGGIVLHRGTIWRSADCSFYRLFDPLPSGIHILEQRVESFLLMNRQRFLAMLMLQLLRSFQPFCSFLRLSQTQVQSFKKGILNSATQDSIMNIHNKIQITYAKINCVLKYSSCDTPLLAILMLAILATCVSSSLTNSI